MSIDHEAAFQSRPEHRSLDFGQKVFLDASLDELLEVKSIKYPVTAIIHLGAITNTREMDEDRLELIQFSVFQSSSGITPLKIKSPLSMPVALLLTGMATSVTKMMNQRCTDLKPLNPYGMSKLHFDLWVLGARERRKDTAPLVRF